MAKDRNSKFTYFISGVYFLSKKNTHLYQGPNKRPGQSDIGFGSDNDDLNSRITSVQSAIDEGNDIGSHVNGHFNGSKWSVLDWEKEFSQFHRFIENVFSLNKLTPPHDTFVNKWVSQIQGLIKGFRAPLLAINESSDKILKDFKYNYDASRTAALGVWPYKLPTTGVWQFPLGYIPIVGTAKKTIAMDYNFYFFDSKGKNDSSNSEIYSNRYFESLMNYFRKSYYGNRAPLNIGNHFSNWNSNAYYNALEKFVNTVCNEANVHCVKYSDLVEEMDTMQSQFPEVLTQWTKQNNSTTSENKQFGSVNEASIYDLEIDNLTIDTNNKNWLTFTLTGKSVPKFYRNLNQKANKLALASMNVKIWPLNKEKKEKQKVSLPERVNDVLNSNRLKLRFTHISNNEISSSFDFKTVVQGLDLKDGAYTISLTLNALQKLKEVEIQTATRDIIIKNGSITELESRNQENFAREAELPGAHLGEE